MLTYFKRNQVASQVVHASPYASLCTLSRKCGNFNGVGWSLKWNLFTFVWCNPPPFQSLLSLSVGWVETGVLPGARLQHKRLKRDADNHLKIFGNHIKQPSPNFGTHDPSPQQVAWGFWKEGSTYIIFHHKPESQQWCRTKQTLFPFERRALSRLQCTWGTMLWLRVNHVLLLLPNVTSFPSKAWHFQKYTVTICHNTLRVSMQPSGYSFSLSLSLS